MQRSTSAVRTLLPVLPIVVQSLKRYKIIAAVLVCHIVIAIMSRGNGLDGLSSDPINGTENGFCRGPYFDYNLSWNTTNPNLAQCFRDTTLIGTPSIAFWVMSAVWVGYHGVKLRSLKGIIIIILSDKLGQSAISFLG